MPETGSIMPVSFAELLPGSRVIAMGTSLPEGEIEFE